MKFHDDLSAFQEFVHEITVMRKFDHDNVVKLVGIGFGPLSMIMELCPLGSLSEALYESRLSDFEMDLKLALGADIASGLNALHTQCFPPLVHRDIRSPNIFVFCHLLSLILLTCSLFLSTQMSQSVPKSGILAFLGRLLHI